MGDVDVISLVTVPFFTGAIGYLTNSAPEAGQGWLMAGGWVLVASAILATYTAAAMMMEGTFGRVVLPLGKLKKRANVPGSAVTVPLGYESGEPGVRHGQ